MEEKLKTIKIIHFAICAGLILAYYFLNELNSIDELFMPQINSSDYFYLLIPIIAYLLSNFLFKSKLKNIDPKLNIEEKYPFYQTALLIRWAVLEGAAFLILFVKRDFMVFGILIVLYLVFIRPTETRMKMDLNENRL